MFHINDFIKDKRNSIFAEYTFLLVLLNNLKMLISYESTVGLDPEERVRFRNLISDLAIDCIVILSYSLPGKEFLN